MDNLLASIGKTAVLFILSTEIGSGRSSEEAHFMEAEYGWPVRHRIGAPDLVGSEVDMNNGVTAFNFDSTAIKVVLSINSVGVESVAGSGCPKIWVHGHPEGIRCRIRTVHLRTLWHRAD